MKTAKKWADEYAASPIYKAVDIIAKAQKEAWDEAVKACAKNATTKEAKVWYTGVRAGGYTTIRVVDPKSILAVKKLFKNKEECQSG